MHDLSAMRHATERGRLQLQVEKLEAALENLFEASRRHDPDDWDGESAMVEAAQLLGKAPFDKIAVENLNDLPRLIELQRTAAPEDAREDGWNAGLDRAAEIVRSVLNTPANMEGGK